jgi:hypothetical protein
MKKSGDRSTPAVSPGKKHKQGVCRYCKCKSNKCKVPVGQKSWGLCVWLDKEHTRCSGTPCVLKWQDEQKQKEKKPLKWKPVGLVRSDEEIIGEASRAARGLTRAFGCESVGDAPAIDVVIMERLRAALASIDESLQVACLQRGLLPRSVGDALNMARFLSYTLPFARGAQAATGVPASILIAEAQIISGPLYEPESHDIFKTGEEFASIKEAFLQRAKWLRTLHSFSAIMRATGDGRIGLTSAAYPSNFLKLVATWSKPIYGNDLVATISAHNLLECDRMVPVL